MLVLTTFILVTTAIKKATRNIGISKTSETSKTSENGKNEKNNKNDNNRENLGINFI